MGVVFLRHGVSKQDVTLLRITKINDDKPLCKKECSDVPTYSLLFCYVAWKIIK